MRWLVRFLPTDYPRDTLLSSVRSVARSVGAVARNPKWTSYGALETDVFAPTVADFEVFLAAVAPIAKPEFVTDLNKAAEYLPEGEILAKAKLLFNAERYWECHEVLENLWRQKQGPEKSLLQGIILVCAAYVHHQKGEDAVGLGVLKRAIPQLTFSDPAYGGFSVEGLRSSSQRTLRSGSFSTFQI